MGQNIRRNAKGCLVRFADVGGGDGEEFQGTGHSRTVPLRATITNQAYPFLLTILGLRC